jgi:hypothetical protein
MDSAVIVPQLLAKTVVAHWPDVKVRGLEEHTVTVAGKPRDV